MPYEQELQVALAAAARAGAYVADEYTRFVPIPNAPATISTEVDRGSQELILQDLQASFPEDGLCAEEATPTLAQAKRLESAVRRWVVDPIDGTRGFARKNGEFSVMIALMQGQTILVGVVLEPALDRWTYATLGGGCWTRIKDDAPSRCQVSSLSELTQATLIQSHSKGNDRKAESHARLHPARLLETYSAGVKLAAVARGDADVYVNPDGICDWDIAAGHLLVTEAGGTVTELRGTPVIYLREGFKQPHGLVATNRHLHASVVDQLQAGPDLLNDKGTDKPSS